MSGFGSIPFGSGPYGVGTPVTTAASSGVIFRDPNTGLSLTGRKLDPATGDYQYDENGRAVGVSSMAQIVYLAISTSLKSAALPGLGIDRNNIDRYSDNYAQIMDSQVRRALQAYTDSKRITVLEITTKKVSTARVEVFIRWRDLTTLLEESVRI